MEGERSQAIISVRATVNLPELRAGEYAIVDPLDVVIAEYLKAEWLVPESPPEA